MDAKEEVRARLNIEDVIGEYVELKRAGRNFKGLSPFSGERTPSFFVSPDKGIWHDFSSNRGGDVFAFVMEVEGLDFRAALEQLARRAGVDLTMYESKGSKEIAVRKKRSIEANTLAANYYQHSLVRNAHALNYVFSTRNLSKEIVGGFMIGYAPDTGSALIKYLEKKGFTPREIGDAGLTNRYGGDMFRGRMMVPLMDPSGQVIGFTGRIIGNVENAPKYLNTPQTLVYDKSRHVFGLSQAKEAIRECGYVVIVEGNLDVVSSHQVGIRQVVATAGTAMTEQHLRALKRLTGDVRLAFDGDKAGLAASERAIEIASHMDIELSIISLPDGAKDPDELIQRDPSLWQKAIDARQPAVDWVLTQYQKRVDMASARGKSMFTTAALDLIRRIDDPVEREHYESQVAMITGVTLDTVHEKLTRTPSQNEKKSLRPVQTMPVDLPKEDTQHQDAMIAAAIGDSEARLLLGQISDELIVGEGRREVRRFLINNPEYEFVDTPSELQKYDTYVKILLLQAETRYAAWSRNDRYAETARLIRQIERQHKKQIRDRLVEELRDAEAEGDDSRAQELRTQLNILIKEIASGR